MEFQSFQQAFANHLRNPQRAPRPAGVPARGMGVYRELVGNNLQGFIDSAFPVCRAILGEARWQRLGRRFRRDWPLHTPWFREIPREFVQFLAQTPGLRLPRWLPELAHYEWVELAADIADAAIPPHDPDGDLRHGTVVLNPVLFNLAYAWPVHRIGPDWRPRKAQATHLLVYRDADDIVRFSETNPVTARLLALLAETPQSGEAACRQIAAELQHAEPERLVEFGLELLADLHRQGIVLGTESARDHAMA
ncbi:DNA-binding domain-containing protein [Azonexus hydrophilus]|uniref:HvfC family RiPP maturation protein n=1 Tax=Azonexus hydrophilus TaxID=418702 RepID=UPI00040BDFF2|nr:DUF2063 domain-containing protein [Azonexus hydrophilus]